MTSPGEKALPLPMVESPGVRLRRWAGILSAWLTAQSLTQLAGLIAGLLLVRYLPVRELAFYTLALSVVTFFTFLSDLGSTGSLVHFFHRAASEREPFPPYLAAVLSLRRAAFLAGALVVVLVFPHAAAAKGYGGREIALVLLPLLLAVWFQIGAAVRVLALRLTGHQGASYRAEVTGAVLRLLLTAALVASIWRQAWLGVLATAAGTGLTLLLARRGAPVPAAVELRPYRRQVLRYLLPTLPSALYFSIHGPLTIWLAATFGSTRNIAEVGALSRLGLIVGIFGSLTSVVFLPKLAQITDERHYRTRCLQFAALLALLALGLLGAAALAPGALLWILGESYSGLHRELVLVVAAAGLTLLGGYAVSINMARAWIRWETGAVLLLMLAQAGLAATVPLGTTAGVLLFNLGTAAVGLTLQIAVAWTGFLRPQWVRWQ